MQKEYTCTRNASYFHDCLGDENIRARKGYYIATGSQEEAWEKMAVRFPEETGEGFTVEQWQGGDVTVVEVVREDK